MSEGHVGSKRDRISHYEAAYEDDYDFERVLVAARHRTVVEFLLDRRPRTVVEAGCGLDLLCARAEEAGVPFERWIVVEPGPRFAAVAEGHAARSERVTVIQSFLEDAVEEASQACGGPTDVVLCSSLLHEVPDTTQILAAAHRLLGRDGHLFVDVPNARSLNRRLGRAMGLVAHEADLSPRNRALLQHRVFDRDRLRAELAAAAFRPVVEGGHFLKPFSNAQMATIGFLDDRMAEGLWALGRELPDLATEIFCVASPL